MGRLVRRAETALLATANLGEGFVTDETKGSTESSESSLGCLDAVEDLDGPAPREPGIRHGGGTFEDDGVRLSLAVEVGDGAAIDGAGEQVAISAAGAAESDGRELPVAFDIVPLRLDNNVMTVGLLRIGESDSGPLEECADTAVARLEAVMPGKPVPSPEQSSVEEQAQAEVAQLSTATVGQQFAVDD